MSFKHHTYHIDANYKEIQQDLNPCPYCGVSSKLVFPLRHFGNSKMSKIQCSNCGAFVLSETMYEAICDWNSEYSINGLKENNLFFRYDIKFLDEDSTDYYLDHVIAGHPVDGNDIHVYLA